MAFVTDPALESVEVRALRRLERALTFEEGFGLHILVVDTRRLLDVVLANVAPSHAIVGPDPAVVPTPGQEEEVTSDLAGRIQEAISGGSDGRALVVDATAGDPWHEAAWRAVFGRLNEARNELIRDWYGPFVIAVHPSLERALAEEAPDLWSIRGPGAVLRDLLTTGTSPLPLRPLPNDLLRADTRAVPFVGRAEQLDQLASWRDDPAAIRIHLIYGAGGTGKTRLAAEFAARCRDLGWRAGFLGSRATDEEVARVLAAKGDSVVVVDYAETRRPQLEMLLELATASVPEEVRFRLLLLARSAGEWWAGLGESEEARNLLQRTASAKPLPPLVTDPGARESFFRQVAASFAAWTGRDDPEIRRPDLDGPAFGHPLYLELSALASLDGLRIEDADALLEATLEHEARHWRRLGEDLSTGMETALCALTLTGGWSASTAGDLLSAISLEGDLDALVDGLVSLYGKPGKDGGIVLPPLEPDLLGEALVDRVCARVDDASQLFEGILAAGGDPSSLLLVLGRLASHRLSARRWLKSALSSRLDFVWRDALNVAVVVGEPFGAVLSDVVEVEGNNQLASEIALECPPETVELRETATIAALKALDWCRESREPAEIARMANVAGWRLMDVGRYDESVSAAEESVEIQRNLAASGVEREQANLVICLTHLGLRLRNAGRLEDALTVAREAVERSRMLVETDSERYLSGLATSLLNLGVVLGDVSQREEALVATREATEHFRMLNDRGTDRHPILLARSLSNLGAAYSVLERHESAFEATREATAYTRRLASSVPDAVLPDLAMSLNNMGVDLSVRGDAEAALDTTREAVEIYRGLATRLPDAFTTRYRTALSNLERRLIEAGEDPESDETLRTALSELEDPEPFE